MLEFHRVISESEVKSAYLNLTDEDGKRYGAQFPPHRTKLLVLDGQDRVTFTQRHHGYQLWGTLSDWFQTNHVQVGTRILVRYDPQEKKDGYLVVHLIPESATPVPTVQSPPALSAQEPATEIPLSLERQLEDFLEGNLGQLEPGLMLFVDEDGRTGRQYLTEVGSIDLLCRRPNGDFLVVELKRGKSSDEVVGQISRYIGWVRQNLASNGAVFGMILTHDSNDYLKFAVLAHDRLILKYFRLRLELISEQEVTASEGG